MTVGQLNMQNGALRSSAPGLPLGSDAGRGSRLRLQHPTVFMVDDDEAVRSSILMLLKSYGCSARVFASAEEFLDIFSSEQPDCLILDLNMPGMNGLELYEKLMADGVQLPVIIITGDSDSRLAKLAMTAGVAEVLAKPFRDDELMQSIERALT